jgi:hypothetical protein
MIEPLAIGGPRVIPKAPSLSDASAVSSPAKKNESAGNMPAL